MVDGTAASAVPWKDKRTKSAVEIKIPLVMDVIVTILFQMR
jgi:hypothetical protein